LTRQIQRHQKRTQNSYRNESHDLSKCVKAHLPSGGSCCPLRSRLIMVLDSTHWDLFKGTMISSSEFRCVSRLFLFFLPSLFSIYKRREKKQRSKKKISKIQWSFGDYTSSTVRKISMKWIQQHKKRLQTVTGVGYTSCLKARELWHIWMARVIHSGHVGDLSWCHWIYLVNIFQRCWWYPHRSFGVSLRSFFFIFFFDFLSPLSYFFNYKLYQFIFRIDVIFLNILNNIFFKC